MLPHFWSIALPAEPNRVPVLKEDAGQARLRVPYSSEAVVSPMLARFPDDRQRAARSSLLAALSSAL
jgi:hypothetical protein